MKPFVAACVAAIVIAIGGYFVLDTYQRTADQAYVGSGARI